MNLIFLFNSLTFGTFYVLHFIIFVNHCQHFEENLYDQSMFHFRDFIGSQKWLQFDRMLYSFSVWNSDYVAAAGPDVSLGIATIRLCSWNKNSIVNRSVASSMRIDFGSIAKKKLDLLLIFAIAHLI